MNNTTQCMSRWRIRALLCCAAAILLSGCGAGSQRGLSNGPQMAAVVVASAEPVVQAGSAEPAVPDPAPEPAAAPLPVPPVAAADPAPSTSPAPPSSAKGDAFALSGYGASESTASTDAVGAATASDNAAPSQPATRPACKYGGCSFH